MYSETSDLELCFIQRGESRSRRNVGKLPAKRGPIVTSRCALGRTSLIFRSEHFQGTGGRGEEGRFFRESAFDAFREIRFEGDHLVYM